LERYIVVAPALTLRTWGEPAFGSLLETFSFLARRSLGLSCYRHGNKSYNQNLLSPAPFQARYKHFGKNGVFYRKWFVFLDQSCRTMTTPFRLSSAVNVLHLLLCSPSGHHVFLDHKAKTRHSVLWQPS